MSLMSRRFAMRNMYPCHFKVKVIIWDRLSYTASVHHKSCPLCIFETDSGISKQFPTNVAYVKTMCRVNCLPISVQGQCQCHNVRSHVIYSPLSITHRVRSVTQGHNLRSTVIYSSLSIQNHVYSVPLEPIERFKNNLEHMLLISRRCAERNI